MAAADVTITEFTDPGCPWALSAEPFRLRLRWLYEDRIEWVPRMVVLSESTADYEEKGLTPEKLAGFASDIAAKHGMPIDTTPAERNQATLPACRAVVATRRHDPEAARRLLRNLRVRNFDGGLLDDPELIEAAAADAGIATELPGWIEEAKTEEELREDMRRARHPLAPALTLDGKLADWSGGRRYTCPSYEITRASDGETVAVPGFQPFATYDVVLANLAPDLGRRTGDAPTAEEVLAWAGTPLATREVAEICELSDRDARQELSLVASEHPVGADGYWSLA